MKRLLAAAALCALTSCSGGGVTQLKPKDLPGDLFRPRAVSDNSGPLVHVNVYFVRKGPRNAFHLVGVPREAHRSDTSVGARAELAMVGLLNGPTPADQASGDETAIPFEDTSKPPKGLGLLGVTVTDNVATVNLPQKFESSAVQETFVLRAAQVVWTLASIPGILAVRFRVQYADTPVIDQDGAVHTIVSTARYARYEPLGTDSNSCTLSLIACASPTPSPGR